MICCTCYVQVCIARSLAQFVRNDTLVDATVGVTHTPDHQTVDIPVCRMKREGVRDAAERGRW